MDDRDRFGRVVLKLSEGVAPKDTASRDLEVQQKLLALPGKGLKTVVLDFSGLQSMPSGTLGAILLLRQALAEEGCGLGVRGCSETLKDALQLLRLECPQAAGSRVQGYSALR